MSDSNMSKEYPEGKQRVAVCISKATEDMDYIEAADFHLNFNEFGYTEEIDEDNFYVPAEAEHEDWDDGRKVPRKTNLTAQKTVQVKLHLVKKSLRSYRLK